MSSGPGTDRLRANFTAGGCRNCFSSSGTPVARHSSHKNTNERCFTGVMRRLNVFRGEMSQLRGTVR